jgi:tetratricopeptide (TPR) repeat protein
VSGSTAKQEYTRREVCRLLRVAERTLRGWEKQDLIPRLNAYGFSDLIALRTLARLRADRVPATRVRRAVSALRNRLRTVTDPLRELRIIADGRRVAVQVGGGKMEPISGQLLLDFDAAEFRRLLAFPGEKEPSRQKATPARQYEAAVWFEKALEIEQRGGTVEEAIEAYEKAIALDPSSAGALVNIGTIYFHQRAWDQAEQYYRQALEADPQYSLAHFNLGNLFDEKNDRSQALLHYMMAIRLNPGYSDAHYNLALLYQGSGQALRAVRHWKAYLKLDSTSPWAAIARQELEKLRESTVVRGSKPEGRGPDAGSVS